MCKMALLHERDSRKMGFGSELVFSWTSTLLRAAIALSSREPTWKSGIIALAVLLSVAF